MYICNYNSVEFEDFWWIQWQIFAYVWHAWINICQHDHAKNRFDHHSECLIWWLNDWQHCQVRFSNSDCSVWKKNEIIHFNILFKNINKIITIIKIIENDVVTNFNFLFFHVDFKSSRLKWFFQIFNWKSCFFFNYEKQSFNDLTKSQMIIERFNNLIINKKHRIIIIIKIKQHQMWTAQYFCSCYFRIMIISNDLIIMKYDLSIVINIKIVWFDVFVIDIDGDVLFNMMFTEFITAIQFNIDVKIIILNNKKQNIMTQWQNFFYKNRFAYAHQKNPNFIKLIEIMNVQSKRLVVSVEITDKLQWLLATDGPALLKIVMDLKVFVLFIIMIEKNLHEFLIYDENISIYFHFFYMNPLQGWTFNLY